MTAQHLHWPPEGPCVVDGWLNPDVMAHAQRATPQPPRDGWEVTVEGRMVTAPCHCHFTVSAMQWKFCGAHRRPTPPEERA